MLSVSGARGLVGKSMTPEIAARLTASFAEDLRQHSGPGATVVIGRDGRPSGEQLEQAACATLSAMGFRAVRLGVVMTPTTAVMIDHLNAVGGIVITASHNPIEWNGLKFLTSKGAAPAQDEAQRIIDRFRASEERETPQGTGVTVAAGDDSGPTVHLNRVLSNIDVETVRARRFKVVLDSVNGAGCVAGRLLLEQLGAQVIHINGEPTGVFAHTPEPVRENLTDLAAQVAQHGADIGFAQDPDADRLAIVDEQGRYIGEEYTFVLAAEEVLSHHRASAGPGALAVNLSSSRMIDDVASAHGARVYRTPVGEANVVEGMKRHACILGGEGNGGVIWPEVCFVRDSLSGMALVLSLLARRGQAISRIVDGMPSYAIEKSKAPIRPGLAQQAIAALAARFPDAVQDHQDGLRLDWPQQGAWLHVRASNTEPILRLIVEARDRDRARAIMRDAASLISSC